MNGMNNTPWSGGGGGNPWLGQGRGAQQPPIQGQAGNAPQQGMMPNMPEFTKEQTAYLAGFADGMKMMQKSGQGGGMQGMSPRPMGGQGMMRGQGMMPPMMGGAMPFLRR